MTEENTKIFHIKRVARAHDLSLLKVILHNITKKENKNKILINIKNILNSQYKRQIELGTLEEYIETVGKVPKLKHPKILS